VESDDAKIAELTEIIHAVRDRVRTRYPQPGDSEEQAASRGSAPAVRVPVADLMPVVHARDAAQAKIAAIGSVNPRAGGVLNKLIQLVKRTISRALRWFVRDQVIFNRESVAAIEAIMEALNEHNRILVSLASQTSEQLGYARNDLTDRVRELSAQIDVRAAEIARGAELREKRLEPLIEQMKGFETDIAGLRSDGAQITVEAGDIRRHWIEWRSNWEQKLATNEVQFLRSVADLQGAYQHRVTQIESNFRDIVKAQHGDYLGALDRGTSDIQKRLWADLEKIRVDYERLIHTELRILRQRGMLPKPAAANIAPAGIHALPGLDYTRFTERFRGDEAYVRANLEFYKPYFAGRENVLDIGCGRGEFLEAMGEQAVAARGIDLDEESVALCKHKGLSSERADLFEYLSSQPDEEFDGIMSSQVVEHLDPQLLPRMVQLCGMKIRRGGVIAIETPNPECLAIFATHFYLDPTHTRPVPHQLLAFYLEEAGFGQIEVHPLSPAIDSMPELAELPENFRKRFFGGLDYAIAARKL
jgi:O-antigen chain-terminating methyltransferase